MSQNGFDLARAALDEMHRQGFHPEFPASAEDQLTAIRSHKDPSRVEPGMRDMRQLAWSSIDNASSRDLDQIEVADRTGAGIRVMIAIADVDSRVAIATPLDQHASAETTSVYTVARVFPMLPEELS